MTHGKRQFKCPDCGQCFVLQHQLKKHSIRHQNLRFVCNICDASLSSIKGLSKHKSKKQKKNYCIEMGVIFNNLFYFRDTYTNRERSYTHLSNVPEKIF